MRGTGVLRVALHHVNFHTLGRRPIFEADVYDRMMRSCLTRVIAERGILCPVWELMPTHVHLIVEDFPDVPRPRIMQHLKGDTSRGFFATYPELRGDLLGGHLWAKGYFAVRIVTHRQYVATVEYIRTNREHADLPPPVPLEAVE